jgi:hypothetical protein
MSLLDCFAALAMTDAVVFETLLVGNPISIESRMDETSVENHIGLLLNPERMTYRFR